MQVEDMIHIDAPPEDVWQVTVEIERLPEWTPTITAVRRLSDGPLSVGSQATLSQPGLPDATWTVTVLEQNRRFTWRTQVRGMKMVASHEIMPDEDGGTHNLLCVELSGLTARLLWPVLRSSIGRALAQENVGLKQRCENQGSAGA